MAPPIIKSGRFHAGADFRCGDNVVIDVAEEVILGDRCVLGDNAYLSGRRVDIGHDFFNYSWEWRRLEVGRGRRDDEHAVLKVGSRCTFHDVRIDLARQVTVGDDVGLSPEVLIYTHYYWGNPLLGHPQRYEPVTVGNDVLVGTRSILLPGTRVGNCITVGAGSVVSGSCIISGTWGGVPARWVNPVQSLKRDDWPNAITAILVSYLRSLTYRKLGWWVIEMLDNRIICGSCTLDLETMTVSGVEDEVSDDLRDFLFKHGLRFYTERPFRKLPRRLP